MTEHQTEQNYAMQKQLLIESRITNEGKSLVAAYILWWLLGVLGGHRFYLGKTGTAIAMLLISLTFIGLAVTFIWWIVDAFLIPGMVRENHEKMRQRLAYQLA